MNEDDYHPDYSSSKLFWFLVQLESGNKFIRLVRVVLYHEFLICNRFKLKNRRSSLIIKYFIFWRNNQFLDHVSFIDNYRIVLKFSVTTFTKLWMNYIHIICIILIFKNCLKLQPLSISCYKIYTVLLYYSWVNVERSIFLKVGCVYRLVFEALQR